MNRENALEIGIIVKTRGINGELILETKDSTIQENIKESMLIEIDGLLVPFFINQINNVSSNRVRIIFDWVDNENKANKLVNCPAFLETKQITSKGNNETLSPSLLEGFNVVDSIKGPIGSVLQFIEQENNPLLIIKYERNEILIPFQDQLIQKIDPKTKTIYIDAPEGLIDLYLEE